MASVNDLLALIRPEVGNTSGKKYWDYYWRGTWAYSDGWSTPYCACFITWALGTLGIQCEGFPSACAFDGRWQANGRRVEAYDLQPGDVINFDWESDGSGDHVGFVEQRLDAGYYMTIEGNASNAVRRCWRDASVILYGIRPYYDTEDEMTEADLKKIRTIVQEEVAKTPVKVWSYKNAKYENVDAYRILRDVRDAIVGKPEGKPADTSAAKTNRIQTIIDGVNNAVSLIKQYIKQI